MPAEAGYKLKVLKNGSVIAGLREVTVSVSAESIDISDGEDLGERRTLPGLHASRTIDYKVSGVSKYALIRNQALQGNLHLDDITLEFQDGATIEGDVFISNFESTGNYKGAVEFTATFQVEGDFVHTTALP